MDDRQKYAEAWEQLRHHKRAQVWICVGFFISCFVVVLTDVLRGPTGIVALLVMSFLALAMFYGWIVAMGVSCPRCEKSFLFPRYRFQWPILSKCVHCGLMANSKPD